MPELTQLERSLRILQRLSTHSNVTVQELYELFDRQEPVRTLQRSSATCLREPASARISPRRHRCIPTVPARYGRFRSEGQHQVSLLHMGLY
jgi:hypothetical protein